MKETTADNLEKCEVCGEEMAHKSMPGHKSGHVRRGDIPKQQAKIKTRTCVVCNRTFQNFHQYGGHIGHAHKRTFESYVQDASRKGILLSEQGNKCSVCGLSEWMGKKIPIEIDHIDGNPENNKRENCRLICPNCHAQTDTYKGRNIGRVSNTKRSKKLKRYYGKYR